ncbi:MAG: metallophosphoesterase family protein [Erysipelotrichaceae bacterium]|nr:metallophosphoesterase family protein [Erysipelotrichaceae bacterium]
MIEDLIEKIREYGLTPEQYELCLSDAYQKANHTIDLEWQEIIDKYGLDIHYDTLRKATQTIFGGAFVSEYFKSKQAEKNDDSYLDEIRAEKQEIRKEKQRLFDERTALNKTLRENARIEEDLSKLEVLIKNNGAVTLPKVENIIDESDNDLFIALSDFHLGIKTDNYFGSYDSDIAAQRLSQYLNKIIKIKELHNSENAYILLLGDLLNGEIHFTTQLENRENVTEQVQKTAELISAFVYELSKHFKCVYVNGVAGNHSRTSFKDQVLRGNRLDNLIPWYMKAKLSHIDNIKFIDDQNYDATIGCCTVRGKEYLMVHGDFDSFSEKGVSKLVMMLGFKPTAIFYGHLHRCSFDDIAGVKIIRSGSFSGTSDDYTISKRLSGQPSQMVCVVDSNGINACYPVQLD